LINDYICLYVVGVWIVVVDCEVWMKMRKYEFLVKNELNDDFDVNWGYDSMIVSVLNVFWCMLTNKQVCGMNLGQRGKLDGFLWGNPKTRCTCLVQLTSRVGACHASYPVPHLLFWVFRVLGSWSELS